MKEFKVEDYFKLKYKDKFRRFKVNDYLMLIMGEEGTHIYVNDKYFIQCKRLIIDIPINDVESSEQINSIDEASEYYDHYLLKTDIYKGERGAKSAHSHNIETSPETEFWGHCSNLQVWSENDYDTRLLHRDLAFPLLKKLTEAGDPRAKRVFKEEIIKRLRSGYRPVVNYLIEENYLGYFNDEERRIILDDYKYVEYDGTPSIVFDGKLKLRHRKIKDLGEVNYFQDCSTVRELDLSYNKLRTISGDIRNFKTLERLDIGNNKLINLPESFGDLSSLKILNLGWNHLSTLPENFWNLTSLQSLYLAGNNFQGISNSISNLISLEELDLLANPLITLPKSILSLNNLKILHLTDTPLAKDAIINEEPIINKLRDNGVIVNTLITDLYSFS